MPVQNPGFWLPVDLSKYGYKIDDLINVIHVFMLILFVGWGIFFVYCLVKFRARPGHKANPELIHAKGSKYAEIGVAIFEAVLLLGFSMPVWAAYKHLPPKKEDAQQIHVVAQQFAWNFHYPGPDGIFGKTDQKYIDEAANPVGLDPNDPHALDDIVDVNNLHVIRGKPVILRLTSKDVIHSFWIPVMRVKQDVIPGTVFPIWFEPAENATLGEFDITCAQLCGNNHFKMRGACIIDTPESYQKWLDSKKISTQPVNAEEEFKE